MKQDFGFFKTTMPESRKADYYLGCLDGSVFLDFNISKDNLVSLVRISFDGYGCCNIGMNQRQLDSVKSRKLIHELNKEEINQKNVTELVKEIIHINKENIWIDAIEEYKLIDKVNL